MPSEYELRKMFSVLMDPDASDNDFIDAIPLDVGYASYVRDHPNVDKAHFLKIWEEARREARKYDPIVDEHGHVTGYKTVRE